MITSPNKRMVRCKYCHEFQPAGFGVINHYRNRHREEYTRDKNMVVKIAKDGRFVPVHERILSAKIVDGIKITTYQIISIKGDDL